VAGTRISRRRDVLGWLGIVAGATVFVAALAVPLDDAALVVALGLAGEAGGSSSTGAPYRRTVLGGCVHGTVPTPSIGPTADTAGVRLAGIRLGRDAVPAPAHQGQHGVVRECQLSSWSMTALRCATS
jgi:hypothetical protein